MRVSIWYVGVSIWYVGAAILVAFFASASFFFQLEVGIFDFEPFGLVRGDVVDGGAFHFFKRVFVDEQRDAVVKAEDFVAFVCGIFKIHRVSGAFAASASFQHLDAHAVLFAPFHLRDLHNFERALFTERNALFFEVFVELREVAVERVQEFDQCRFRHAVAKNALFEGFEHVDATAKTVQSKLLHDVRGFGVDLQDLADGHGAGDAGGFGARF